MQRAAYDAHGPDGPSREDHGPMFDGGMDDLFESMFGGGGFSFGFDPNEGFGSSSRSRKPARGKNTDVPYSIGLEESYKGKRVVMNLERDRICGICKG